MKNILFLLVSLAFLQLSCSKQPNVVLIMADDMGAECLRVYGGTSYATPNLDRMADQGLVVSHCIAQPLCTPSRVKLMTGLYNHRNYEYFGYLDTSWQNMGNLMQEAGYRTCISGKWQLNGLSYPDQISDRDDPSRPHQMGFDTYCLWQLTRKRSEGERYADPLIEQDGKILDTGSGDYGPDIFCNFLLDFIEQNRDQPFFAYYPMVLVHEPFVPTPDSEAWQQADRRNERDTAYFREMMSYTDKLVGKILDKLEETGLSKHTILIFTADNGTDRNIVSNTVDRRVQGAKGMTISDGVRVPLIINWPQKIRRAVRFEGLVEFSDFYPTLAGLIEKPCESDGKSFLPLLLGKHFEGRQSARVYYDPRWGAFVNSHRNNFIQNLDYKLYQNGKFFHMKEDILEQNSLDVQQLEPGEQLIYNQLKEEWDSGSSQ